MRLSASNPNGVPVRIRTNPADQTCAHWVGDDVPSDGWDVRFCANRAVMESFLPEVGVMNNSNQGSGGSKFCKGELSTSCDCGDRINETRLRMPPCAQSVGVWLMNHLLPLFAIDRMRVGWGKQGLIACRLAPTWGRIWAIPRSVAAPPTFGLSAGREARNLHQQRRSST